MLPIPDDILKYDEVILKKRTVPVSLLADYKVEPTIFQQIQKDRVIA